MLMLIDYSSLLFRSFHTIPESVPMHAVYGFLNMLARLVTDRRPDQLGIAVDEDWRPAFRVEALPAYKAHRVSDESDPNASSGAIGSGSSETRWALYAGRASTRNAGRQSSSTAMPSRSGRRSLTSRASMFNNPYRACMGTLSGRVWKLRKRRLE